MNLDLVLFSRPCRMSAAVLTCALLCLSIGNASSLCESTAYTLYVERQECAYCVAINTTICAGFCVTRDVNLKSLLPKSALSQSSCTYQDLSYHTVTLPGCPLHSNPSYSYAVALTCRCRKCNTDYSECTMEPLRPSRCTKPPREADSYLGQSNFIQ
ncbi:thyrotropin subunit beta-like isoform X1 [Acipenser ruthenus]|nr:thyrotropin subunit beta-like isoform X1 [Acipenser ruthenus]